MMLVFLMKGNAWGALNVESTSKMECSHYYFLSFESGLNDPSNHIMVHQSLLGMIDLVTTSTVIL